MMYQERPRVCEQRRGRTRAMVSGSGLFLQSVAHLNCADIHLCLNERPSQTCDRSSVLKVIDVIHA